ncbi:MAG: alpha-L-fucosidase [Chloroflexota bacterium]|nr:alpha-L-fucosidase [Chloroflexota bacterium]
MQYKPNYESLKSHAVPDWYHDAKLGIFIHWGLYSVPGWAPPTGDLDKVVAEQGWEAWFKNNPYSEWYLNSLRFPDSPTRRYHSETYGEDFGYDGFVPMFEEAIQGWDPDEWAALFESIGARYVVLVTKHHDGFTLWPTHQPSPHKESYHTGRNLVGELTASVRKRGMRMGLYYSGGLDWTFNSSVVRDLPSLYRTIPQEAEYVEYADAHWWELIERYAPSILWNDIGYPAAANLPELFAYYYNSVPEGVINDRFGQQAPTEVPSEGEVIGPTAAAHLDFKTPEYTFYTDIQETKWEVCRGVGHSFGYNRAESPEDHIPIEELIRLLVDVVSKNGNLLLNIGPMADGSIPDLQRERLEGLGQWLRANGEAIYGTRPWVRAEDVTGDGIRVRYTRKDDALYAILLGTPPQRQLAIKGLGASPDLTISLLGAEGKLDWSQDGDRLTVTLPSRLMESPAHALRLTPIPAPLAEQRPYISLA